MQGSKINKKHQVLCKHRFPDKIPQKDKKCADNLALDPGKMLEFLWALSCGNPGFFTIRNNSTHSHPFDQGTEGVQALTKRWMMSLSKNPRCLAQPAECFTPVPVWAIRSQSVWKEAYAPAIKAGLLAQKDNRCIFMKQCSSWSQDSCRCLRFLEFQLCKNLFCKSPKG